VAWIVDEEVAGDWISNDENPNKFHDDSPGENY